MTTALQTGPKAANDRNFPQERFGAAPAAAGDDSSHVAAIPQAHRHGPVTMGLLWITMVTSFPSLLIGFEWYKQGICLKDVIFGVLTSCALVLVYYVPICLVAARTGLSFKHLSETVFGALGSKFLVIPLIFIFLGWYTVCALLMSDAFCGVFASKAMLPALAAFFSFAMAFNNFFGFKGVANFAKFFGGPVLICWILFSFFKIAPEFSTALSLKSTGSATAITALTSIMTFTIGFAIWGNEADYWRHSKPKVLPLVLALSGALLFGEIIFPVTGWLIAFKTGIVDSARATSFMTEFSFGGLELLAIVVLAVSYFAANDSNLYALTHAFEGFAKLSHKTLVFYIALVGALASFLMAKMGAASALEQMCALNSVVLPVATVLIVAEYLLFRGLMKAPAVSSEKLRIPAFGSFSAGVALGLLTSGVLPGLSYWHIGLPPLQAWLLALVIYIPWRTQEIRRIQANICLAPEKKLLTAADLASAAQSSH